MKYVLYLMGLVLIIGVFNPVFNQVFGWIAFVFIFGIICIPSIFPKKYFWPKKKDPPN